MMIDPPIDKLIDKIGCKYALVSVTAKRARYLIEKHSDMLEATHRTAVTYAAKELYDGRVEARSEE